jgi:hypothetical protein
MMSNRLPRRLVWGLTKGVIMLVGAVVVTYGAAMFLQYQARKTTQEAAAQRSEIDTRRDVVPPQSGAAPDGREVARPGGPRPAPSPGPNPTPAR